MRKPHGYAGPSVVLAEAVDNPAPAPPLRLTAARTSSLTSSPATIATAAAAWWRRAAFATAASVLVSLFALFWQLLWAVSEAHFG